MVNIYTGSGTNIPVGMIMDYNNTNPSVAVKMYRTGQIHTSNPISFKAEAQPYNNFAQAIYADGPYSLLHPNTKTDIVANNIDLSV